MNLAARSHIRIFSILAAASGIWQSAFAATPTAVPTFESVGLYWDVADGSTTRNCAVQFRSTGDTSWQDAQSLWFDNQQRQYRGSVVRLTAGANYEFQLTLANGPTETVTSRTWSNTLPVASTVTLPTGISNQTLQITSGGTPGAYKLYTAAPGGSIIDVANTADTCINIEADYVIVRGVTCRGAAIHGLQIGNHKNVVIEGCDISGWGRPDPKAGQTVNLGGQNIAIPANLGKYLDAGIHIDGPDSEQVIIQGNKIHHARYTANNWTQSSSYFSTNNNLSTHPQGPDAVVFAQVTKGRHVIRWNNIGSDIQDLDHMFNDALLASEPLGNGLATDSDIYGNRISDCWDDGIEAERGDRNVRIWGNHFTRMIKCVSVGYIWQGPVYVWGNVAEDLLHPNEMSAPYNGGHSPFVAHPPCFIPPPQENPAESRNEILFVYHNTLLTGSGAGAGWAFNTWKAHTYSSSTGTRLVSRNNIWQTRSYPGYFLEADSSGTNYYVRDFQPSYFSQDYDLHSGIITPAATAGAHTIQGEPTFLAGNGAGSAGLYQLAAGTPGHDDGLPLANFNDGFTGTAPDRGAHESGLAAMVFGRSNWTAQSGSPGGEISSESISYNAIADATVNSQSPTVNYGSAVDLGVQKSNNRNMEACLRFNVSGLTGTVTAAKLRLKESTTGTSNFGNGAMSVRAITGAWTEAGVKWSNKPAYSATSLGSVPALTISQNKIVEIALDPAAFTADGSYDLAVIGTTDGNDTPFNSREAGTDPPQLILTTTTTGAPSVPAAPSHLDSSAASGSQINLSWSDNSFNETGFTVERKTGAGGTFVPIATPTANTTTFSDNGLTNGVNYYYRVRANGTAGNSGYSNETNSTTQTFTQETLLFTTNADARVESSGPNYAFGSDAAVGVQQSASRTMISYLRFTVSALPGTVTAAKLRLKESTTGTSNHTNSSMSVREITSGWAESTVTYNNRPSYSSTSLGSLPANSIGQDDVVEITLDPAAFNADGTYNLAVTGTSNGGDVPFNSREAGSDAPQLDLTVSVMPTVPTAPSNLDAAAVSENRIKLSWSDNSSNETGFTVERKTGAGDRFAAITTTAANTTRFSDTGRSPNATYFYRISAGGTAGNSGYSNEANATPLPTGATNLRFPTNADTFVNESAATTNYGGEGRISVYQASGSRRRVYLRFELSGIAGVPVQTVALEFVERMESIDAGVPFEVRKVTGAWTENSLNWNNQPAFGTTSYGSFTPVINPVFIVPSNGKVMAAPNQNNGMRVRVELDPSLITGDGTYDLALIPVSGTSFGQDMDLYSREETWQQTRPRLIINGRGDYTGESDLAEIGANVSEYVLRKGVADRFYDDPFYSSVLSYYGILTFAAPEVSNIPSLVDRAIAGYDPYLTYQGGDYLINNVDGAVLGIVPFEIFRQRGGQVYQDKGIQYAIPPFQNPLPSGASNRTRWWIDDMFMLGAMQASAYESTAVSSYANSAATQMIVEGLQCQQPSGLAWHRNDTFGNPNNISPNFWGRGNGWMAAGMTRTLQALPADHPQRVPLLTIYQNQMEALRNVQDADGMWHQLLDRPDSYKESSATALFIFSMANGITSGWLDQPTYLPVVENAWAALAGRIQTHGRVTSISWGGPSRAAVAGDYMVWPEVEGDNHGQGAVLLAIESMIRLRDHLATVAGFTGWSAANGIPGEAWNDDFDHDGWKNGLEYALTGLDPTASDPSIPLAAGGVLSYIKRAEAVANGDVSYVVETSPSLISPWTPATPDVDNDTVISYTLPVGSDRLFGRLRVIKQ